MNQGEPKRKRIPYFPDFPDEPPPTKEEMDELMKLMEMESARNNMLMFNPIGVDEKTYQKLLSFDIREAAKGKIRPILLEHVLKSAENFVWPDQFSI